MPTSGLQFYCFCIESSSSLDLNTGTVVGPHVILTFVHTKTKDHYRQIYYEVLDAVTVGLTGRFEPDATATHLANVEKFLTGQQEHVNYIVSIHKDDVNGTRLTLHRNLLMK